ncbi:FAD-dependent oxidoreductase [Actinocrinis puniceicyclus]|uniref:FAD-dependent oxidoreductase n=1 Tax=Actinocrinis puniceicyclus TaxID=977794 RepID=A0A8J7WJT0_9ACTN|nr:FAD-dependent oxidoreductase [Actinocrinis puniceicyclus]MBS2963601.1 FAD-dependent oxidoreductase [Actinocrinis puniceicyclus]
MTPPTAGRTAYTRASERGGGGGRGRVAVIGSGVSGLTAAYLLQRRYEVALFEADPRLGGHAHTHDLPGRGGRPVAVDSGFIVHNLRTYPRLTRLFGELGIATQETDMSMSVRCEGCGVEYAGARGLRGLFARPNTALRPEYLRMLAEVKRFHRQARRLLSEPPGGPGPTLGDFLRAGGYSRFFADHFMVPLVSAVWSTGTALVERYPARYLFRFLDHHGMLAVTGSPRWRTVVGGSRTYVERAVKGLTAIHVSTPVRAVSRTADGVRIVDDAGDHYVADRVVVATHADQALRLLADPTEDERAVLSAIPYSRNETLLHTDASLLPKAHAARGSWNYLLAGCSKRPARPAAATAEGHGGGHAAVVSYHMNRLHRLDEPEDYLVTMNATERIRPERVLARMLYEHPVYTPESVAAQARLPQLNTAVTAFAGAYHGWGFHEDGCASGVAAAEAFGVTW